MIMQNGFIVIGCVVSVPYFTHGAQLMFLFQTSRYEEKKKLQLKVKAALVINVCFELLLGVCMIRQTPETCSGQVEKQTDRERR